MKHAKRLFLSAALIAVIATLAACGNQGGSPSVVPTTTTAPKTGATTTAPNSTTPPATTSTQAGKAKQWSSPPAMQIDVNKQYTATIKTNKGDFEVQLFASEDPITVNNFVFLARQGFYDGTVFHRIVKGFVIQGGDPAGTGSGGPGYKFADEKVTRDYMPGILAMANSGANTNGSQFFVCLGDLRAQLSKAYTIFGQVTTGMDVVQAIGSTPTAVNQFGEKSLPLEVVKISTVVITEK